MTRTGGHNRTDCTQTAQDGHTGRLCGEGKRQAALFVVTVGYNTPTQKQTPTLPLRGTGGRLRMGHGAMCAPALLYLGEGYTHGGRASSPIQEYRKGWERWERKPNGIGFLRKNRR